MITSKNLPQKVKEWKKIIEPYNYRKGTLKVEKSALIVIDMQRYFLEEERDGFTEGGPAVVENVVKLITAFRKVKRPVIFTAHVHKNADVDGGILAWWWGSMCMEGTEDAEIYPILKPMAEEKIIYKHRYSAFYNTDLEIILRCQKIEDIVITGVMTNICCESTARDAYFRDLRVFFTMDGTGASNEDLHLSTLKNLAYGFAYVVESNDILSMF